MRKFLATAIGSLGIDFDVPAIRSAPFRGGKPRVMLYQAPRNRTTLHKTNGKRECERRQRQIAAGSLRVENGLAS
jgi:hypothetical protein